MSLFDPWAPTQAIVYESSSEELCEARQHSAMSWKAEQRMSAMDRIADGLDANPWARGDRFPTTNVGMDAYKPIRRDE